MATREGSFALVGIPNNRIDVKEILQKRFHDTTVRLHLTLTEFYETIYSVKDGDRIDSSGRLLVVQFSLIEFMLS